MTAIRTQYYLQSQLPLHRTLVPTIPVDQSESSVNATVIAATYYQPRRIPIHFLILPRQIPFVCSRNLSDNEWASLVKTTVSVNGTNSTTSYNVSVINSACQPRSTPLPVINNILTIYELFFYIFSDEALFTLSSILPVSLFSGVASITTSQFSASSTTLFQLNQLRKTVMFTYGQPNVTRIKDDYDVLLKLPAYTSIPASDLSLDFIVKEASLDVCRLPNPVITLPDISSTSFNFTIPDRWSFASIQQGSDLFTLNRTVECGYSPAFNKSIISTPDKYSSFVWSWDIDLPSSDSTANCAIMERKTGRWRNIGCQEATASAACRNNENPHIWQVTTGSFAYDRAQCSNGSFVFSVPRSPLENLMLLSKMREVNADRVLINLYQVKPGCWVSGLNTPCPFSEQVLFLIQSNYADWVE